MEKRTPLYDRHVAAGAKMVPYAGYLMPVEYSDIITEHMSVRQKLGLFDVSHMGEFLFSGKDALLNLNYLLTNDLTGLAVGRVRYSPMCNPGGGIIDDLLVCRLAEEKYLVVVNAANREKDFDWMQGHIYGQVWLEDISDDVAQLALQGPEAEALLGTLADSDSIPGKYYSFTEDVSVGGVKCVVSRTGYTGEAGFEIYCAAEDATALWDALTAAGEGFGLRLCGLGARDTLRLEAAMPLYGHEMDDTISPLETGLSFAVKLDKENFIGKTALVEKGEPKITRVGLRVTGRGIIREHCPVLINGETIGETTSGTFLPYLNGAYAMALVDKAYAAVGTAVEAEVRGRRIAAEIVPLPFYKKA